MSLFNTIKSVTKVVAYTVICRCRHYAQRVARIFGYGKEHNTTAPEDEPMVTPPADTPTRTREVAENIPVEKQQDIQQEALVDNSLFLKDINTATPVDFKNNYLYCGNDEFPASMFLKADEKCTDACLTAAIERAKTDDCNGDILKTLLDNKAKPTQEHFCQAIESGNANAVKLLADPQFGLKCDASCLVAFALLKDGTSKNQIADVLKKGLPQEAPAAQTKTTKWQDRERRREFLAQAGGKGHHRH